MVAVGPPTQHLPTRKCQMVAATSQEFCDERIRRKLLPCRAPRGLADPWATATHASTGNHIWDKIILAFENIAARTFSADLQRRLNLKLNEIRQQENQMQSRVIKMSYHI